VANDLRQFALGLLNCALCNPKHVGCLREFNFEDHLPELERIRSAMIRAYDSIGACDELAILDADPKILDADLLEIGREGDGVAPEVYADRLRKAIYAQEVARACDQAKEALRNGDTEALTGHLRKAGELAEGPSQRERLAQFIVANAYREDVDPPEDVPVLKVDGKAVLTRGNIGVIAGQSKAGKSAVIQSMIASAIGGQGDNLKLHLDGHSGALIHLDTEQSRADHYRLVDIAKRRAMVDNLPGNVLSLSLKGESPKACRELLCELCRDLAAKGQRIGAILIDGVADLAVDVNSIEESHELVRELEQLATKYDTAVIGVLHLNPGSEFKTRGHLGSQLERKAECNLRLEKKDGVTVIYSELNRRAAIPKEHGPRFEWSDAKGMHVSVASAADAKQAEKQAELADLARAAFEHAGANGEGLSYTDLWQAVGEVGDLKERAAKKRIGAFVDVHLVNKHERTNNYFLTC